MTKKNYEKFAMLLAEMSVEESVTYAIYAKLVQKIVEILESDNVRFDENRFRTEIVNHARKLLS